MENRGIVILALKKPNYGKWAFNLAISIKHFAPKMKIQLIHDREAITGLDEQRLKVFDIMTSVDESFYNYRGKFNPGRAKILAYKLYAFKENIQMDADSICVQDVNLLFDKCTKDIQMQCNKWWNQDTPDKNADGTWKWHDWITVEALRKHLNLTGKYEAYGVNSSFIFMRKSKAALAFAKDALAVCDGEKIPGMNAWGKSFPDELGWGIAIVKQQLNPTFEGQVKEDLTDKTSIPNFFPHDGSVNIFKRKEYFFMTFYGGRHFTSSMFQNQYDRMMRSYLQPLGLDHHYKIHTLLKDKHVTGK